MDRFSLLLLEPGEIYFTDVGVTFIRDPNKSIKEVGNFSRGRLKICSKSIVFVPQVDHFDQEPLLKFPLCDCAEVKGTIDMIFIICCTRRPKSRQFVFT